MKTGSSDLQATGKLESLIPFVLSSKNNELKGNFVLNSSSFKVADFLIPSESSESEKSEATTSSSNEGLIPKFLNITSSFNAKKVFYDNLELKNTSGNLAIKDQKATLKNVKSQLFDGTIALQGTVNTQKSIPDFNMTVDLKELNIAQSFLGFSSIQKMAPIAQALEGAFSTKIDLNGKLKDDLSLDLNSIKGGALATILNAKMNPGKNKLMNSLNQKTKFLNFDKLNLSDLTANLNFEDGKIKVKPFKLKIKDNISANIGGSHSFDGGMDYLLNFDVPAKYLGSSAGNLLSSLTAQEINSMSVPIPVSLKGDFSSPNIGLNMKGAISNLTQQVVSAQKTKLKNKATNKVNEVIQKQAGEKVKNILGGVLGNKSKTKDSSSIKNKTSNTTTTEKIIKKKAGKLLDGLFGK